MMLANFDIHLQVTEHVALNQTRFGGGGGGGLRGYI